MSEVVYRDATAEDAEALSAFSAAAFTGTFGHLYPPEDLKAFLGAKYGPDLQRAEIADPRLRCRLALSDGRIVGYCLMGALDLPVEERDAVELHRLYVDESVKGKGVAQALMDEALAWARGRGAKTMYLSVWENNERAQRFYRRYGFVHHGEWEFMVGRVADRDLIWRLAL